MTEGTVGVIVDPTFGERLRDLPAEMPVWVRDTPINRDFVKQCRLPSVEARAVRSITSFVSRADASPEQACIGILQAVDMHHNQWAQQPPYSAVAVFGTHPTAPLRAALADYGLVVVDECDTHFVARKAPGGEE
jgi:hypothetical protein